jgi:hypothetical protein
MILSNEPGDMDREGLICGARGDEERRQDFRQNRSD